LEEYVPCPGQQLHADKMADGNLQEKRQFTTPSHKCADYNEMNFTAISVCVRERVCEFVIV
jgi:hypothetical protein